MTMENPKSSLILGLDKTSVFFKQKTLSALIITIHALLLITPSYINTQETIIRLPKSDQFNFQDLVSPQIAPQRYMRYIYEDANRDNQITGSTSIITQLPKNQSSSNNNDSTIANTRQTQDEGGEGERSLIMGVIIANIVIFGIGLCGNAVVILVILKFTRTVTVTDIYILNLAFADLMFITGLIFLITTMFIEHWIFGNIVCKLYMATTSLNQFASSLLLVVMSFDRFLAVCHPLYAQRFRRHARAKIICLCIWFVCLILMTPIFAFAKINKDLTCAIFWPDYKSFNCEMAFTMYSFAIGFAGPLLLIAAFYLCVIRKLRKTAKCPVSFSTRRRSKARGNNRRIEHLVIGIICTYTICWLPYWIAQLCVSFSTGERSPMTGFYEFYLVATSLTYTNSALNPILYAFLSDNFKRRCSDIWSSICSIKLFHQHVNYNQHQYKHSRASQSQCQQQQQPCLQNSTIQVTGVTACCESESSRPESRQTVVLTESVRLIPSLIGGTSPVKNELSATINDQHQSKTDLQLATTNNYELTIADEPGNYQKNHLKKKNVAFTVNTGNNNVITVVQSIDDNTSKVNHQTTTLHTCDLDPPTM